MEVDLSLNFTWSGNLWSHDQRVMENDIISYWHHSQSCDFPCFPAPSLVCSQSEVIWNKLKAVKASLCLWFDHFLWPALALASYWDHLHSQVNTYRTKLGQGPDQIGARQLSHSCGASSPQVLQPYFQPTEPSKQLQRIQATYVVQCALPFCMT